MCHRRLSGSTRSRGQRQHTYYRCPHDPGSPRHAAAYPGHRTVIVREDLMMDALTQFFTERVFGPGRAAMLAAALPASDAAQNQRRQQRAAALRKKLARMDVTEKNLLTELEEAPAGMPAPADSAYRNRIRARFTGLYADRTAIEAELATLEEPATEPNDPTLLDELPTLGDILTGAPAGLTERLLDVFDIKAVCNRDKHQVTIHATITGAAPQAVIDLLTDPRADHNRQPASGSAPAIQGHFGHLAGHTGASPRASTARQGRGSRRAGRPARGRSASPVRPARPVWQAPRP
jgi:site-specific DNA recombinase